LIVATKIWVYKSVEDSKAIDTPKENNKREKLSQGKKKRNEQLDALEEHHDAPMNKDVELEARNENHHQFLQRFGKSMGLLPDVDMDGLTQGANDRISEFLEPFREASRFLRIFKAESKC
jgi:hypothetical protein